MLFDLLPEKWRQIVLPGFSENIAQNLDAFIAVEYAWHTVYPPSRDLFSAFRLTSPENVKVVILGQDPYHEPGQAHGLAFSVPETQEKLPPSLRNIYQELHTDIGTPIPNSGSLIPWAEQGVLLLNAVLTVRAGEANSHKGHGWEEFTDHVITKLDKFPQGLVFILWGSAAGAKKMLIKNHWVLLSPHPSPLSAFHGFFGSRPFSRCNALLQQAGLKPVDWGAVNRQNR